MAPGFEGKALVRLATDHYAVRRSFLPPPTRNEGQIFRFRSSALVLDHPAVFMADTSKLDGDPESEEVEWLKQQFDNSHISGNMVPKGTAIKIQVSVPAPSGVNGMGWDACVSVA